MATTLICMKDEADAMDQPEARANAPHSSLAAGSGAAAGETTVSPRNPTAPASRCPGGSLATHPHAVPEATERAMLWLDVLQGADVLRLAAHKLL